jgi:hypothetical protein
MGHKAVEMQECGQFRTLAALSLGQLYPEHDEEEKIMLHLRSIQRLL